MASQKGEQKGQQQGPQQLSRITLFWWLILVGLLVWNIMTFWPRPHIKRVNIPYTTFLAQVRADNVSKVHITDDNITGSFIKPFLWPQTTSAAKPSTSQQSKASPAVQTGSQKEVKGAQPESQTPATYTEFDTTF